MIKIKDYIFNEKEIKIIHLLEYSKYTEIEVITNERICNCGTATFDDIEWNYGQNKADDEYIELSNKYQRLLNRSEELEEENKKLKFAMRDTYDSANDTCGELQQRINELEKENERLKAQLELEEDNRHFLNNKIGKAVKNINKLYKMVKEQDSDNVNLLDRLEETIKILKRGEE